ncbi:MAG: radical SAM protein [Candidatus Gastranaerophilaceae bacterium]
MNRRKAGCGFAIAGCIYSKLILTGGIDSNPISIEDFKKTNIVPALDIHLVEHCNLSCKYCGHFSNIAEPEYLDIDKFEKDLIRLKKITNGKIEGFKLMGGEPLLHPLICDFFDLVRKYFPDPECTFLMLITNGVLLNSMKSSFWENMHNNSVLLNPSIYPINIDWDKVFEKSQKYGVELLLNKEKLRPIEEFYKSNINLDGKIEPVSRWKNCNMKCRCAGLQNGKIYQCAFAAYMRHFNKKFGTSLVPTQDDYIDIYKAKSVNDIFNFFEKPFPFCKYCGPIRESLKWETSKEHDITEWLYIS